jgi:hypothetical protein
VGHRLAGQDGGEWILLWRCGGPSVYPKCDREGRGWKKIWRVLELSYSA